MNIEVQSVSSRLFNKTETVADGPAVQLTSVDGRLVRGITIKANTDNDAVVYVGGPEVQNAGENKGFPLAADESLFIAVSDPSQVYVVTDDSASDQTVSWVGI